VSQRLYAEVVTEKLNSEMKSESELTPERLLRLLGTGDFALVNIRQAGLEHDTNPAYWASQGIHPFVGEGEKCTICTKSPTTSRVHKDWRAILGDSR
jgi:hypothetical protein